MDNYVYILKEKCIFHLKTKDIVHDYVFGFSSREAAIDYLHDRYVESLEQGYYRRYREDIGYLSLRDKKGQDSITYVLECLELWD